MQQAKMKGILDMALTKEIAAVIVAEKTVAILKQQGEQKTWRQAEHCAMLRNCVMDKRVMTGDEKEQKVNLGMVLSEGSCGNTSAYRQSLKNADGTPMFPNGKDKGIKGYE